MSKIEINDGKIEIAFNAGYGGFGISKEALDRMAELGSDKAKECIELHKKSKSQYGSFDPEVERYDPILIQVIKELGNRASGSGATLAIGIIHMNDLINIDDYDGKESIERCYDHKVYGRYDDKS